MLLKPDEVKRFFRLLHCVQAFANQRLRVFDDWAKPEDVRKHTMQEGVELRNRLIERGELFAEFAETNPFGLDASDLAVVESWQHFVSGEFCIIRQLKDYAVFLKMGSNNEVYGVVALSDPLEDVIGRDIPIVVKAVLLPFEGRIIYDSLLSSYHLTLGGGIRKSLEAAYQETKAKSGIITSLPVSVEQRSQSDADLLRFYLKSASNRERYQEEIWDLIDKDHELLVVYYQEMGKSEARRYKARFAEMGLNSAWFAIFQGLIIASGPSEDDVRQSARRLVPRGKEDILFVFQYKRKA